jgi:hypothetical protein
MPVEPGKDWKRGDPIEYIRTEIPEFQVPACEGDRYHALAPDTLDLQERAVLGVNGLTGPTDPMADYELYWVVHFLANPTMMTHDWNDHVQVKFMEALPLLRLASGSGQNPEVEQRWMEVMLHMQGPDGLLYWPKVGRPWCDVKVWRTPSLPEGEHYTVPYDDGRLLGAMGVYLKLTGDRVWRESGERVVAGLSDLAVERGQGACFAAVNYPPGPLAGGTGSLPESPIHASFAAWTIMGLAQFYGATGHEPARELAGKLASFLRGDSGFHDGEGGFLPDDHPRRGTATHFHHHVYGLLAMAETAMTAADQEMMEFARKGFEYGRANGDVLLGYFPEFLGTPDLEHSEICEVADMLALALKLTEAGVGDYWDDVDRWTRNMFAEGQLLHTDWIARMPFAALEGARERDIPRSAIDETHQTNERVAERNLGAFAGWPKANDWYVGAGPGIMHCCTGNGARAIYYVWENIVTHDSGKLRVNLLLNRASPWVDVDSHIPYVGQVDVKVKQPVDLSIRIPEWVAPGEARVQVNGSDREVSWKGRYAEAGAVKPGDLATVTFPIAERTDTVWIEKEKYTLVRKGNDVVSIDPPGRFCPLYQRDHYRQNATRWRRMERFVSKELIHW